MMAIFPTRAYYCTEPTGGVQTFDHTSSSIYFFFFFFFLFAHFPFPATIVDNCLGYTYMHTALGILVLLL